MANAPLMGRQGVREVEQASEYIRAAVTTAMGNAGKALFNAAAIKKLETALTGIDKKMLEAQMRVNQLKAEGAKKGLSEELKAQNQIEAKRAADRLSSIQSEFKEEISNVQKVAAKWDTAQKAISKRSKAEWLKNAGEAAETFGEGISAAFAHVKAGNAAGLLKQVGAYATKKGEEHSGKQGAMGGLGEALKAIGPALMGIAAMAAGFAAIVKIVLDADAKIKELNKDILAGGVVANDLGEDLTSSLTTLRSAFSGGGEALKFVEEWGVSAKENVVIMNAWGNAGLTVKEIAGDIGDQAIQTERLRDANKQAIVYSKLLGESADKIAGDMGEMMEATALSLDGVRTKYSEIAAAAKESGFSTKRFYGMVLQLTSGMSMYNVRLSETLGMLTTLGKLYGAKKGAEMAASMTKGLKDTSTEDRLVMKMKMGGGRAQAIGALRATSAAGQFQQTAGAVGGEQADQVKAALTNAGLGGNLSAEEFAKKSSELTQDQTNALTAALNGIKDTLGTQFAAQQKSSLALKKGGTVAAMSEFGPAETGLAKLYGLAGVLGKRLDQISETDLTGNIAADKLSGMSPEERANAVGVARNVTGMQTNAAALKVGSAADIKAFNETQGKLFKVALDEKGILRDLNGNRMDGGDEETFNKLYLNAMDAQKDKAEDMAKQLTDDQKRAQEVVENTQSISDKLDSVVEALLTEISSGVMEIVAWLPGSSAEDRKAKKGATDEIKRSIAEAKAKLAGEKDPAKVKELKAQLQDYKAQRDVLDQDEATGLSKEGYLARSLQYGSQPKSDKVYEQTQAVANSFAGAGGDDKEKAEGAGKAYVKATDELNKKSEKRNLKEEKNLDLDLSVKIGQQFAKVMEDSARADAIMKASGGNLSADAARTLATGGTLSGEDAEIAGKYGRAIEAAGGPKVQAKVRDAYISMEKGGKRSGIAIADNDVVSIQKPGGGLSNPSGGGNHATFNIYDGGQALQNITKWQRATGGQ